MYTSPFEKFVRPGPYAAEQWTDYPGVSSQDRSYTGTVSSVLNELHSATVSDSPVHRIRTALHPPRLIQGFLNWNIENPARPKYQLTRRAINTALAVYQGIPDVQEMVTALSDQVKKDAPELQTALVEELADDDRWMATFPEYSYKTAEALHTMLEGRPVLFVAIAHGGTAAGMDVFNRYTSISNGNENAFYAVRYSARKIIDTEPQVSENQKEKLKDLAENREVVLFDELTATGTTLHTAKIFLQNTVFEGGGIVTATNVLGEVESQLEPDIAGYLY